MYTEDTIAAIATAQGTGGIGIIRLSGREAFDIAGRLFSGKKRFNDLKSHTVSYGRIVDSGKNETVDEVLIVKMAGPHTYTREDVVEIDCHGGPVVLRRILGLVVREGARLAEPGEFTRRAFLNGRMDLSQAEAVIDLINSKTAESSRASLDQLEGRLSKKIREARGKLIELIAHIEVTVDYPEHDIEEITSRKVYDEAGCIHEKLADIIKGFDKGRIIREGIRLVIAGRPNVGKSSLLNGLAGKNRAIVTEIPGTTRDIIEEYINIKGIPARVYDTAGIRETLDEVEKIGVEKAVKALDAADLVIFVLDAGTGMVDEDMDIFSRLAGKKVIIVLNKIDLAEEGVLADMESTLGGHKVIRMSVKQEAGFEELESEIEGLFLGGGIASGNEVLVTNVRHKDLIDKALTAIDDARLAYENGMPLDCIAIDIKNAADYLGRITGEFVSEDVMHEIFKRFCIGK